MEPLVRSLLTELGENPDREGLKETPRRVAKAWKFLTRGYGLDPKVVLNNAVFSEVVDEMVTIRNIEIYSMCEHHLLPFFGKAHVAYLPNGKIIGFSKIPRLVDIYARRLQVQERLTRQIADTIQEVLQPKGVAVVIEAVHLCMTMRGVEKQNSVAVTSAMLGGFRTDRSSRMEFLELIRGQSGGMSA
ncbi:MAG: GTP cyclohydrolase I [bacterium]|nr:MAG: GTP cyclohydrolase I [bacterium]